MKAPDKIYIAQTTFPDKIDWDGSPINTKRIEETDEEFIRKEALMEWAQKRLRSVDYGDWYELGLTDAFSEIIDKINSL